MNINKEVEIIKKEHRDLEREFFELKSIIQDAQEEINYANLVHLLKKLFNFWDMHEANEEKLFPELEKQGYVIPVDIIFSEHKDIRGRKDAIIRAINSGKHSEVIASLNKQAKELIDILEEHVELEDEILYRIV